MPITRLWSARSEARKIWFSLFTPQEDQLCPERLSAEDRVRAVAEIARLRTQYARSICPRQSSMDSCALPRRRGSVFLRR